MKKLLFLTLLLMVIVPNAFSQQPDIQTLRGLSGVTVAFQKYPELLEQDGLPAKQIAMEAELRLRKAGIKVLTPKEAINSPGSPVLGIALEAIKSDEGLYVISIRIKFMQMVTTQRKPSVEISAPTWEVTNLLMVGKTNLRQVKEEVGDGVDFFANDFLSVNPKP